MENALKFSQMISHIKSEFSPKVSEVYNMSLNVGKNIQDGEVNPLSEDAKNTPSIYICINQENMQWQKHSIKSG
jgi:hypothetical protein